MNCPSCGITMEFAPTVWPLTAPDVEVAASVYFCRVCACYWERHGKEFVPKAPPFFNYGQGHV